MNNELNLGVDTEKKSAYRSFDDATLRASNKAKKLFSDYLNGLILTVCIAFTIALPLVTIKVVNPFSLEFLANTVYNIISTYLCYVLFIPQGKKDELKRNTVYAERLADFKKICAQLRTNKMLSSFVEYCRDLPDEKRKDRRKLYVNNACIEWDVYLEKYSHLRVKEDFKPYLKSKELCRQQVKWLMKANNRIDIKPINPSLILTEINGNVLDDVGTQQLTYEQIAKVKQPVQLAVMSIVLSSAVLVPTNAVGIGVVITIIIRILGVCIASFSGFSVGAGQIRWENDQIQLKRTFIDIFLEKIHGEEKE